MNRLHILRAPFRLAALAALGLMLALAPSAVASENLIPNGDLASGPEGFTAYPGRGAPAGLEWQATGASGPGSLSVQFVPGSSGGPAWYAPSVDLAAGASYIASVSSRSPVASELLARYELADGAMRYRTLRAVDPSSGWQTTRVRLSPPEGAVRVSIYQELITPGALETDDYRITLVGSPDLRTGIPNGRLEQDDDLDPSRALGWSANPNPVADYRRVAGRGGGRAVQVTLSHYRDSDRPAYWEYDPVPVTAGAYYEFSNFYRSNVSSRVYLEVQKADGSFREIALKAVGPSRGGFSRYGARFYVPSYAKAVLLIHVPLGRGTLTTDDYRLTPARSESFDRPTVSLTFDDGEESHALTAAPALARAGVRATFYPTSGWIDRPGYLSSLQLRRLAGSGHEIGGHTVTHPNLAAASRSKQLVELVGSRLQLEAVSGLGTITGMASPYGAYDGQVLKTIAGTGYSYHRSLDEGFNSPDEWDPLRVRSYLMLRDTTPEELAALLSRAAADRTWLVLVYHGVDESGNYWSVSPAALEAHLAAIASSGARVLPVRDAVTVLSRQVKLTSAAVKARSADRQRSRGRPLRTPS